MRPEQVRRIRALMSPTEAGILKHHRPQTGLDAKFSVEFALAAAILAGRVGLRELTDEFVRRPDVQELLGGSTSRPPTTPIPTCPPSRASSR